MRKRPFKNTAEPPFDKLRTGSRCRPPSQGGGAKGASGGSLDHLRLTRRKRSEGVTMSVRRMPNFSFTTTTSPWAIR